MLAAAVVVVITVPPRLVVLEGREVVALERLHTQIMQLLEQQILAEEAEAGRNKCLSHTQEQTAETAALAS
jgi:hypothetical protein